MSKGFCAILETKKSNLKIASMDNLLNYFDKLSIRIKCHTKSQEKFGNVASFISKLSDLKIILAEVVFISIR